MWGCYGNFQRTLPFVFACHGHVYQRHGKELETQSSCVYCDWASSLLAEMDMPVGPLVFKATADFVGQVILPRVQMEELHFSVTNS